MLTSQFFFEFNYREEKSKCNIIMCGCGRFGIGALEMKLVLLEMGASLVLPTLSLFYGGGKARSGILP